jgi:hypothetical protein
LTDDLVDQGAPDGLDLGKFWHTRTTVVRLVRAAEGSRSVPRSHCQTVWSAGRDD